MWLDPDQENQHRRRQRWRCGETSAMTDKAPSAEDRARQLESEAVKMMAELSDLSAKLRHAGQGTAAAPADGTLSTLFAEFQALQQRLQDLLPEGKSALRQLDRQVRTRPYLFVLGALALGYLVGKIRRS